jgi:hypothetical protein
MGIHRWCLLDHGLAGSRHRPQTDCAGVLQTNGGGVFSAGHLPASPIFCRNISRDVIAALRGADLIATGRSPQPGAPQL